MTADQHPDEMHLIRKVVQAAEGLPKPWKAYPGGYPDQVESALLDAVFSIRARYGREDTGVRAVVKRYREKIVRNNGLPNSLRRLATVPLFELEEALQNKQRVHGGASKAAAARQAALNLVAAGVEAAADIDPLAHKNHYTRVKGLGSITWEYFCMLLGHPGVKADTWIVRWTRTATEDVSLDSTKVRHLICRAADELHVDPRALDHAIWAHARSHSQSCAVDPV